ncbi:UDP-galactose/UDP-glucose transporter 7 [Pelomyxa schiedti]|nr:UDP-galactose/UDP-glucose transporter 7 [Pelomyxa schiedti]
MIDRCGPASPARLLSASPHVLADEIGRAWVVSVCRELAAVVRSADCPHYTRCCVVVAAGVSHTMGVVWEIVSAFGGYSGPSVPRGSQGSTSWLTVGCFLGCGKWLAMFHSAEAITTVFVMNSSGRLVGRIPNFQVRPEFFTNFASNGEWLVLNSNNGITVWRLQCGLPALSGTFVKLDARRSIFLSIVEVRFPPNCRDEVALVCNSDLLFVNLQSSFETSMMDVVRHVTLPHPDAKDVLWLLQPHAILTLHSTPRAHVVYNTATGQSTTFPHNVYFIPPSHIGVMRNPSATAPLFASSVDIYSARDLATPLFHNSCPFPHRTHKKLPGVTQESAETSSPDDNRNRHRCVLDPETRTVLIELRPDAIVASEEEEEEAEQKQSPNLPRPASPPWPAPPIPQSRPPRFHKLNVEEERKIPTTASMLRAEGEDVGASGGGGGGASGVKSSAVSPPSSPSGGGADAGGEFYLPPLVTGEGTGVGGIGIAPSSPPLRPGAGPASAGGGCVGGGSSYLQGSPQPPGIVGGRGGAEPNWKGISVAVTYGIISIAMVFFNKGVLTYYAFHWSNTLALFQMLFAIVLLYMMRWMGYIEFSGLSLSRAKLMAPFAVFFCGMVLSGLSALKFVNIPAYTTLKRMTTLFVIAGEFLVMRKAVPTNEVISVVLMALGALIVGFGDWIFNAWGYFLTLLSCAMTAGYLLRIGAVKEKVKVSEFEVMLYNNLLSLPLVIVLVILLDSDGVLRFPYLFNFGFLVFFFGSAIQAFFLNYFMFLCSSINSPLTTSVTGQIKAVLGSFLGLIILQQDVTVTALLMMGLFISSAGSVYYGYVKYQQQLAKPKDSPI